MVHGTIDGEEKPDLLEYPGVVARYYRSHPWFGWLHIMLGFVTGGMWLVGWFTIGWFLFWAGVNELDAYREQPQRDF